MIIFEYREICMQIRKLEILSEWDQFRREDILLRWIYDNQVDATTRDVMFNYFKEDIFGLISFMKSGQKEEKGERRKKQKEKKQENERKPKPKQTQLKKWL